MRTVIPRHPKFPTTLDYLQCCLSFEVSKRDGLEKEGSYSSGETWQRVARLCTGLDTPTSRRRRIQPNIDYTYWQNAVTSRHVTYKQRLMYPYETTVVVRYNKVSAATVHYGGLLSRCLP